MKRILFLVLILAGFAVSVQAQPNQKLLIYTDTTLAGQIHGSNTASAAAIARGFTGFTYLRDDIQYYNERVLVISFRGKTSRTLAAATSFTADTAIVQGLLQKKTSPNKMDSVWINVPLRLKDFVSGINTAKGTAEVRDTVVTVLTPGLLGNAKGYVSPQIVLEDYYDSYRVVNGKCDSGRVVIKEIFKPRW